MISFTDDKTKKRSTFLATMMLRLMYLEFEHRYNSLVHVLSTTPSRNKWNQPHEITSIQIFTLQKL